MTSNMRSQYRPQRQLFTAYRRHFELHYSSAMETLTLHDTNDITEGTRLSSYWPLDNESYPDTVLSTRSQGCVLLRDILYDNGEKETLDLTKEQFCILELKSLTWVPADQIGPRPDSSHDRQPPAKKIKLSKFQSFLLFPDVFRPTPTIFTEVGLVSIDSASTIDSASAAVAPPTDEGETQLAPFDAATIEAASAALRTPGVARNERREEIQKTERDLLTAFDLDQFVPSRSNECYPVMDTRISSIASRLAQSGIVRSQVWHQVGPGYYSFLKDEVVCHQVACGDHDSVLDFLAQIGTTGMQYLSLSLHATLAEKRQALGRIRIIERLSGSTPYNRKEYPHMTGTLLGGVLKVVCTHRPFSRDELVTADNDVMDRRKGLMYQDKSSWLTTPSVHVPTHVVPVPTIHYWQDTLSLFTAVTSPSFRSLLRKDKHAIDLFNKGKAVLRYLPESDRYPDRGLCVLCDVLAACHLEWGGFGDITRTQKRNERSVSRCLLCK